MSEVAIRVSAVSKQYRLGAVQDGYATFRDALAETASALLRPFRFLARPVSSHEAHQERTFWALQDVSFEVQHGEVLGVIGRNGSGKSTLLKILSRITEPSRGYAEIQGRVGSLLEVGTGFHPELTGRENIYLNGAILGMGRAEIRRKFDEIVAFSEIERFADTPVKHYSSGMYLRLAFAVAAHLEPEILLMDEVLAVGDAAFQRKCLGKMGAVAREGRTVLFVSHNLAAIRELCSRAIWLDGGTLRGSGAVSDVSCRYLKSMTGEHFRYVAREHGLSIESVVLKNHRGVQSQQFCPGDDLTVEVGFHAERPLQNCYVLLLIDGVLGHCFAANMLLDGAKLPLQDGRGAFQCTFRQIPLLPQSYTVRMKIRAGDGIQDLVPLQDVASFEVVGELEDHGLTGDFRTRVASSVSVMIPYQWTLPDGSTRPFQLRRPREVS